MLKILLLVAVAVAQIPTDTGKPASRIYGAPTIRKFSVIEVTATGACTIDLLLKEGTSRSYPVPKGDPLCKELATVEAGGRIPPRVDVDHGKH